MPKADGERRGRSPRAIRKRESIQYLKDAAAGDRLRVLYQPIVDARSRRPVALEALLRWREPRGERHDLTALLAAAERSPVIYALERWVVKACGAAARGWRDGPLAALRLNVNLSAREFDGRRPPARVRDWLRLSTLDPARVTLEITETSAIAEPEAVRPLLQELRGEGFQIWLDDFGTGHSSLEWLLRLPADGVKIPSTFVRDLPTDDRAAAIAGSVIELAHRLGLRVVAEGIERDDQHQWLAREGCDELQGFLFCPALSSRELARRLSGR